MKDKIFSLFKRILFSFVILYGFNTIGSSFNLIIPINVITISLITLLGFPALFSFLSGLPVLSLTTPPADAILAS